MLDMQPTNTFSVIWLQPNFNLPYILEDVIDQLPAFLAVETVKHSVKALMFFLD